MIRRLFRLTVRIGVLVAAAAVVKKILDSQQKAVPSPATPDAPAPRWPPMPADDVVATKPAAAPPAPARAPAPPAPPKPPAAKPKPKPTPEPVAVEPEPIAVEPAPIAVEPEPEPAPVATEPKPAPEPAPVAKKAARPKRAQPLRAERKSAERGERPVRANRGRAAGTGFEKPSGTPAEDPPTKPLPNSAVRSWVEPVGNLCPTTHPVKAKLGSKVFRVPGMPGYDTSRPDRCYASEGAARRAGFTEAQR